MLGTRMILSQIRPTDITQQLNVLCYASQKQQHNFTGLEIPVDYKLTTGNAKYLKRVLRKLKRKEATKDLNFSDIMKC